MESASRGAETVELVEFDGKASEVCQRNADLINGPVGRKAVSVHRSRVESFLERTVQGTLWDLVFLDPPYPLDEPAMGAVLEELSPYLAEGAVVVVERSSRSPEPSWPASLEWFAEKKYGETKLWFAEPAWAAAASRRARRGPRRRGLSRGAGPVPSAPRSIPPATGPGCRSG